MPKLIISRKGFDSGTGGAPNPRLGDQLYALPIPQAGSDIFYQDLRWDEKHNFLEQMQQLGITFYSEAHLDPDLVESHLHDRLEGWKAAFGQTGAAASHLADRGVGPGDLFLFFAWFREAERNEKGVLRFRSKAPDQHIFYGYLEVGQVINLSLVDTPDWAKRHPHHVFKDRYDRQGNLLYVSAERSSYWPGMPGAGTFDYREDRVLTLTGENRSIWRLPDCLFRKGLCRLSYHEKRQGTAIRGTSGQWRRLQSVARGQEFVCDMTPRIREWVKKIK
ncbi:MAG: hypothetical protein AAF927_01330 [Bacteroidota bacterium]